LDIAPERRAWMIAVMNWSSQVMEQLMLSIVSLAPMSI
jgi:hypothetical protein